MVNVQGIYFIYRKRWVVGIYAEVGNSIGYIGEYLRYGLNIKDCLGTQSVEVE